MASRRDMFTLSIAFNLFIARLRALVAGFRLALPRSRHQGVPAVCRARVLSRDQSQNGLFWRLTTMCRSHREPDMINRRIFISIAAASVLASIVAVQPASAQSWPTRPVTMVVPFAAGGAADIMARILGARLSEVLGQQVVIENVGGAGGMTGVARVAKAAPDGYRSCSAGVDTYAQNQTLYKRPALQFRDRFRAGRAGRRAGAAAGRAQRFAGQQSAGVHRLREGQPGERCNTARPERRRDPSGLRAAQLRRSGVDITHVPYRGSPPAMQDLIAGRIDYSVRSPRPARRRSKARR